MSAIVVCVYACNMSNQMKGTDVVTLSMILNRFSDERFSFLKCMVKENKVLKEQVNNLQAQVSYLELQTDDEAVYENRKR